MRTLKAFVTTHPVLMMAILLALSLMSRLAVLSVVIAAIAADDRWLLSRQSLRRRVA